MHRSVLRTWLEPNAKDTRLRWQLVVCSTALGDNITEHCKRRPFVRDQLTDPQSVEGGSFVIVPTDTTIFTGKLGL